MNNGNCTNERRWRRQRVIWSRKLTWLATPTTCKELGRMSREAAKELAVDLDAAFVVDGWWNERRTGARTLLDVASA